MIVNPWSEKIFGSAEEEKKCYENFDAIVCVAETMKEAFIQKYGMAKKVHVLYNPIDFDSIIEKSKEKNGNCSRIGNRVYFRDSSKDY